MYADDLCFIAVLVKVVNDVGGVCDAAKQPIQLGHDDHRLAFLGGGQEPTARRATGQGLAGANAGILEGLREV